MASLTLVVMVVTWLTCHLVILSVCTIGFSLVNFSLCEVGGNLCQFVNSKNCITFGGVGVGGGGIYGGVC